MSAHVLALLEDSATREQRVGALKSLLQPHAELINDALQAVEDGGAAALLSWIGLRTTPEAELFSHLDTLGNEPEDFETSTAQFKSMSVVLIELALAIIQSGADANERLTGPSVIDCIMITGTFVPDAPWSDHKTAALAERLLQVAAAGSTSTQRSIVARQVQKVLFGLREAARAEGWKRSPATKFISCWVITQVRHPDLGGMVEQALPLLLPLIEHFRTPNKVLGLTTLHHLVAQSDPSELRLHSPLLVEVLGRVAPHNMPELLTSYLPCYLSALSALYPKPSGSSECTQAVAGLVRSLELEANVVSLQCYANAIPQLLQMMGLMMVKHLKQLMPRVCEWVDEARHHPLLSTAASTALCEIIRVLWPRISCCRAYQFQILKAIGGAWDSKQPSAELVHCIELLQHCCDDMESLLEEVEESGDTVDKLKLQAFAKMMRQNSSLD